MPLPDYRMPLNAPKTPNFADSIKAMYEPRNQQTQLLGKELENIFNEIRNRTAHEKNKADIGYTRAQTGLANANTGYVGAQTGHLNAGLPYAGGLAQAQMQQAQSTASQAQSTASQEQLKAQRMQALAPILMQAFEAMGMQQGQPNMPQAQGQMPGQEGGNEQFQGVPFQMPGNGQNVAPSAPNAQQQQFGSLQKMLQTPILGEILAKELGISAPQHLTGTAQNYASLEALKARHGEDSDVYRGAKRSMDLEQSSKEQLNKTRQKYLETADKRGSSPLNKLILERDEAASGFLPGSNGQNQISEEESNRLVDQYDLQIQKNISDQDTRKRALLASNIDKTIKQIDVDDLTRYAGLFGTAQKTADQVGAMRGQEKEEYAKYLESQTAVETLAMQVRQFYGESIMPEATQALDDLVNPATWKNNPALAKRQFNKMVGILENETDTYRNALQGTSEFKKQKNAESNKTFTIRNRKTGESKTVTADEARKLGINIDE